MAAASVLEHVDLAHALPDEEYDLSYLPEAGAGTNRHSADTRHKLRSVGNRVSG
jgi:hypothetical protein